MSRVRGPPRRPGGPWQPPKRRTGPRNRVAAPPEAPPAPLHEASRARPAAYRFPDSRRAFRPAARPRRPGLRRAGWGSRQPAGWKWPRSAGPPWQEGKARPRGRTRPDSRWGRAAQRTPLQAPAAGPDEGEGRRPVRHEARRSGPRTWWNRRRRLWRLGRTPPQARPPEGAREPAPGMCPRLPGGTARWVARPEASHRSMLPGIRHQWRSPGMAPATDPPPVVARHPR